MMRKWIQQHTTYCTTNYTEQLWSSIDAEINNHCFAWKKNSGLFLIFRQSSARIELRTWRCKADVLVRERARTFPLQEFVSSVSFHIILETLRNPGERAHCVKITKKSLILQQWRAKRATFIHTRYVLNSQINHATSCTEQFWVRS